jgi:hypothetical protein
MTALIHTHSFIAWLLLLFLLVSIVSAIIKSRGGEYRNPFRTIFLLTLIFTHVQLILGFVLYFISPKVEFSAQTMSESLYRFFTLEHPLLMIIAVVLITIGYSRAGKATIDRVKFKRIYVFYLIGLVLILLRFPWQYLSAIGRGWFD